MSFFSLSRTEAANALTHLVTDYWCDNEDTSSIDSQVHAIFSAALDRLFAIETHMSDKEFDSSDLTYSLDKEQRAAINSVQYSMEEIRNVVNSLQSDAEIVCKMVDQRDFSQWLDLALIAYIKTRQVSPAQIASLGLQLGARNQFIYDRRLNILYSGNPAQVAFASDFHSEIRTYRVDKTPKYIQSFFNFSDQEMQQFLKRLKRKPLSEKYYTTIEMPVSLLSQGHQKLIQILNFLKPVEEDSPLINSKHTVMVIPSFSMLQECARQHLPDDVVPMMPLLGKCEKREITKHTLQGRCVFHVGTSKARVLFTEDGDFFGEYSYSLHDFYHLLRKAIMGASSQRAVCYLVGCIFKKHKCCTTEAIRWKLTDGELHTRFEPFGILFSCSTVPWDSVHVAEVVKNMATIPEFWQATFGITPDQLKPKERQLYDALLRTITGEERARTKRDAFLYFKRYTHPANRFANYRLGCLYFDGYGTESSDTLAKTHFELAGKSATHFQRQALADAL